MAFVYLLSAEDRDLELARAELWAMTGCEAQGLVGVSHTACDISRAAYIAACGELLAEGEGLEELCRATARLGLEEDQFRVEVRDLPPRSGTPQKDVARSIADAIEGYPNLDRPRVRFLALGSQGHWRLLRLLSTIRRDWLQHSQRPRNLSIALSAQHARALVNLVAAPGDVLWDPLCGVGTVLIQASSMGVRPIGSDSNRRHVQYARENLGHFGFEPRVMQADARQVSIGRRVDAMVLDFPYGHASHVEEGLYAEALNNLAPQALRIAVVVSRPADRLFEGLGLAVLRRAVVSKHRLARHFYILAAVDGGETGRLHRPGTATVGTG